MPHVKRLLPWALALVVLTAAGCAQQGTTASYQGDNATTPQERQQLRVRLDRATQEYNKTQTQLAAAITEVAIIKQTLNGYSQQTGFGAAEQRDMERGLEKLRREVEQGRKSPAEFERTLEKYVVRLIHAERGQGQTVATAGAAKNRLQARSVAQKSRLDQLRRRMTNLHKQIIMLQQKLDRK